MAEPKLINDEHLVLVLQECAVELEEKIGQGYVSFVFREDSRKVILGTRLGDVHYFDLPGDCPNCGTEGTVSEVSTPDPSNQPEQGDHG